MHISCTKKQSKTARKLRAEYPHESSGIEVQASAQLSYNANVTSKKHSGMYILPPNMQDSTREIVLEQIHLVNNHSFHMHIHHT